MQAPDEIRLKHMIDACGEIIEFTKNKSRQGIDKDRRLALSLVQIDMRNRLVHGYFDIAIGGC